MNYKDDMLEGYLDSEQEYWDYGTEPISGNSIVDTSHTGMSFYDDFLNPSDAKYMRDEKNLKGEIVLMSPEEYYEECAKYCWPGRHITVEKLKHERGVLGEKIIEKLKTILRYYRRKLCMPMINYANPGQEGLHRMYTIGELYGWDFKVPVLKVTHADADRAKKAEEEKRKQEIDWKVEKAIQETLRFEYLNKEEIEGQLQYYLERAFEFWDEIEVPMEIKLAENDEAFILNFEGYEYPIEKDEFIWKEPEETLDDDMDMSIDDLESEFNNNEDFLVRYFGKDWRDTHPHLKDIFKVNESYRCISLNEDLDPYLISQELIDTLISEFGEDFDKQTLCDEVCTFIKNQFPSCEKLSFNIHVYDLTDGIFLPISCQGHCVILKDNILYDYTSNQYTSYPNIEESECPRVLEYDKDLSDDLDVKIYRKDNYAIVIGGPQCK